MLLLRSIFLPGLAEGIWQSSKGAVQCLRALGEGSEAGSLAHTLLVPSVLAPASASRSPTASLGARVAYVLKQALT